MYRKEKILAGSSLLACILIALALLLASSCSGSGRPASQTQPNMKQPVAATQVACPGAGLPGASCFALDISCPNIPDYTAYVKMITPANPVGTIIFTTGGDGITLYEQFTHGTQTVQDVVAANFEAVQLTFGGPFSNGPGWEHDVNGKGVRAAACRYAEVVEWLSQQAPGVPLCATGNSAGGENISEGLAHYNLANHLDFAEITSGPPFNRVDWACMDNVAPQVEYCSGADVGMGVGVTNAMNFIDPAYPGPWCSSSMPPNQTTQYQQQFLDDSVTSSDAVLDYPNTRIRFLFGGMDTTSAINQGMNYQSKITSQTSFGCIADAPHTLPDAADAASAVAQDLIANCHK